VEHQDQKDLSEMQDQMVRPDQWERKVSLETQENQVKEERREKWEDKD
jgi:hypothetical protein